MRKYIPNPFGKTNCDKCVFARYYSKTTWACRVGGFRDRGSSCNIMSDDMREGKDGIIEFGHMFIDKTKCTPKQVKQLISIVKEIK